MHYNHKMSIKRGLLAATLACTYSSLASAQTAEGTFTGITSGGDIAAPERTSNDDLRTFSTKAQLSGESDLVSASFALDLTVQHAPRGSHSISSSITVASVRASIPLNSSKGKDLIDFKSFGNDGKFSVSFNHYATRFPSAAGAIDDYNAFGLECVKEFKDEWFKKLGPEVSQQHSDQVSTYLKNFDNLRDMGYPITSIFDDLSVKEKGGEFGKLVKNACKVEDANDLARRYGAKAFGEVKYRKWRKEHLDPTRTFFWGGQAAIGYNKFSIADRTTLALRSADRVGFDFGAHAGWVLGDANWVVLASGGYARTYAAQKVVDLCGPPDSNGRTTCINGQDGDPIRKDTGYATLGFRRVLSWNKNGQPMVGIRPSATYILQDKDWQFELPIYLQRNEKGGLDAGIRAIYNTGKDKIGFGAFVGTSF